PAVRGPGHARRADLLHLRRRARPESDVALRDPAASARRADRPLLFPQALRRALAGVRARAVRGLQLRRQADKHARYRRDVRGQERLHTAILSMSKASTELDSTQKGVLIDVRAVSKIYRRKQEEVYALREVSLAIERGEYLSIMGPSGSGKSTLF